MKKRRHLCRKEPKAEGLLKITDFVATCQTRLEAPKDVKTTPKPQLNGSNREDGENQLCPPPCRIDCVQEYACNAEAWEVFVRYECAASEPKETWRGRYAAMFTRLYTP